MLGSWASGAECGWCADQVGSPTWADSLAQALWAAAATPDLGGIHHWTDAGVASWYDFAVAIAEEAHAHGSVADSRWRCSPITTADYPTPARRPAYSVLDRSSSETGLWTQAHALARQPEEDAEGARRCVRC